MSNEESVHEEEQEVEDSDAQTDDPPRDLPKRKRGRPRGTKSIPVQDIHVQDAQKESGIPQGSEDGWSRDPSEVWTRLLEEVGAEKGYTAHDWILGVQQAPVPPFSGDLKTLGTIQGVAVAGTDEYSPAEMLLLYIRKVFHMAGPAPRTKSFFKKYINERRGGGWWIVI